MVKQIFVGMMDSSSTEQAENEADLLKVNPGVYIIARVVKNGNVDCNTQLHYLSNSTFPLFSRAHARARACDLARSPALRPVLQVCRQPRFDVPASSCALSYSRLLSLSLSLSPPNPLFTFLYKTHNVLAGFCVAHTHTHDAIPRFCTTRMSWNILKHFGKGSFSAL